MEDSTLNMHIKLTASAMAAFLLATVTLAASAWAQSQPTKPIDNPNPIERFTIARNDAVHECFPSLCKTGSGRLILAYRESDAHQPRAYTRLIVRYSDDDGRSWSDRHILVSTETDVPDQLVKFNCPKVQQLKDGRLLYLCDKFVNDLSKSTVERYKSASIVFWFSEDNGTTWGQPVETAVVGVMPDEVVETKDGAWLLATQLVDPDTACIVQWVTKSSDKGATWEAPVIVAKKDGYDFCEASIVECPDGLLICYMRENKGLGRPVYKCFSRDGGQTWEGPHQTLMDGGHRPVAHFTNDGRILATYRYFPGRGVAFQNTFAFIESEKSAREPDRAKQRGVIMPLDHDRGPHSDTGYTGWVEIGDGQFYAVNYICDTAPKAQIRGYRFSLDAF